MFNFTNPNWDIFIRAQIFLNGIFAFTILCTIRRKILQAINRNTYSNWSYSYKSFYKGLLGSMRKKLVRLFVFNTLFSGSLIMVLGSTIANAINYFYHVIVGRMLGPSSYGELAALLSLAGFLGVIPASINLVVVKFISASKTEEDKTSLINWFQVKTLQLSFIIFLLLILISPVIKSFLHISDIIYVIAIAIFSLFSLLAFLNKSILQGLLRFKETALVVIYENSTRLLVTVLLIYFGLSVGGAMVGLVISAVVGCYLTYRYLKVSSRIKTQKISNIHSLVTYTIPVVIQSISLISIYSSDLILVKHFFSSHNAGIYAALSTLGKIIYFGAGPIGAVMFPLVSLREAKGDDYKKILMYSFITTLVFSVLILLIYLLIPQFAINLLYGSAYQEAAGLLVWFGVFITLFTLSSLIISFHLSLGNTRVVYLSLLAAVLQIVAIWFYHSSLLIVIIISTVVTALLLALLLIYSSCEKNSSRNKFNISNSPSL